MNATWKTPEFWATIIANVMSILAVTGVVTPGQSSELAEAATQISGAVLSILTIFGFIMVQGKRKEAIAATAIAMAELAQSDEDVAAVTKMVNKI
jgi:hypothetical protein